jgi:hypothetical protein
MRFVFADVENRGINLTAMNHIKNKEYILNERQHDNSSVFSRE